MADKPISEERAKELLRHTLTEFERDVNSVVKVPLTQGQFDALVDFAYNVGTDIDADNITEGLGDSTLLKKLNAGDYDGAAKEFGKWVYSKGVRMAGLVKRRKAEVALFSQKEVL
jgi:lysozyme